MKETPLILLRTFCFWKARILNRSREASTLRISPVLGSLDIETPTPREVSASLRRLWKQTSSSSKSVYGSFSITND